MPWYVSDDAEMTLESLRLLPYASTGGCEGILAPPDLRVTALATPAGAVQIGAGSCVVLTRGGGSSSQAYAARMTSAEQVIVEPTDSSGARSDLVIVRIEDPYHDSSSWALPADPTIGPYVYSRVINDVPTGTTDLTEVRPEDSAIVLARIDIPANTSTVTQAMITDLRQVANPRSERRQLSIANGWATADTLGSITDVWETFPLGASWNVAIPVWASRLTVTATLAGLLHTGTTEARGNLRLSLGDGLATAVVGYRTAEAGRNALWCGGTLEIPSELRGTIQPLTLEGLGTSAYTGVLTADYGTAVRVDLDFALAASTS